MASMVKTRPARCQLRLYEWKLRACSPGAGMSRQQSTLQRAETQAIVRAESFER